LHKKERIMGFFIGVLALLALYLILHTIFKLRFQVVPEEKRLVIYRLGRFHRFAGPGIVVTWRTDTVEREINARNEPHNLLIKGLYMKGIPFGYTLNMWLQFDPVSVAGSNREQLRELALFDNRERERQIVIKLREALTRVVVRIENGYELTEDAKVFEKLLPIFPGLPLCEQLLNDLKVELKKILPSIGVKLTDTHPITISALHLSSSILQGFKHGHIATLLREQFDDLSSDRILHTLSTIEGLDLKEQRIILDSNSPVRASMDFREGKNGMEPRLKTYLPTEEGKEERRRPDKPIVVIPDAEKLTSQDLQVLKPVPAYQASQSSAA